MLHNGRQRHRERLREFADGQVRAGGQTCKERTPRWVGQRGESAVQCVFLKLNHKVNYRDSRRDVKPLLEVFSGRAGSCGGFKWKRISADCETSNFAATLINPACATATNVGTLFISFAGHS
jgi:hypothetical protein